MTSDARTAPTSISTAPANILVKHHGQDAPIHAAMRADAMLDKGDLDGCAVWRRMLRAVEELLSKKRPAGVTVQ